MDCVNENGDTPLESAATGSKCCLRSFMFFLYFSAFQNLSIRLKL